MKKTNKITAGKEFNNRERMSYEILDHTADAKFRATGDSVEEAFSEVVKAFGDIVGTDPEAGNTRHNVKVEAENYEALLFDFLDELIYLQDANNIAVCHAEDLEVEETEEQDKPNNHAVPATMETEEAHTETKTIQQA